MSREIEFKFLVDDEAALDAFARSLGFDRAQVGAENQQNTFFDSAEGTLRRAGLALRLRIEKGRGVVTLKGKAVPRSGDPTLADRFEAECTIAMEEAREILNGSRSPVASLAQAKSSEVRRAAQLADSALGSEALLSLGTFENERTTLPAVELKVGDRTEQLVFELDRTVFPGNRIDCEIELEIRPEADTDLLQSLLHEQLKQAGVRWKSTTPKFARFLEALGGQN